MKRQYTRKAVPVLEGADVAPVIKEKNAYGGNAVSADDLPGADPKAAAYAVRVWNGQSPDLPIAERIERVLNALRGQNLLTNGLSFPPLELVD